MSVSPTFPTSMLMVTLKIILIEREKITNNSIEVIKKETLLVKNDEIAKPCNKHFVETVEKLSVFLILRIFFQEFPT